MDHNLPPIVLLRHIETSSLIKVRRLSQQIRAKINDAFNDHELHDGAKLL